MDRDALLKVIDDDDLGLLNHKPKAISALTEDERLLASFQEINEFVRQHGKEPEAKKSDIHEMRLYSRLAGLREKTGRVAESLGDYDTFGLLGKTKTVESVKDIFNDDELGLLSDDAENIFTLKHVHPKEIAMPDYIARRKPCEDFEQFEILFRQCQTDLASTKRKLIPFSKEMEINEGDFFVLKGILVYVAQVGERESPVGEKYNARLRCIFENGTESDMLLRSLAAELYKNGRRVTKHDENLLDGLKGITAEDRETGYIYVLKSLSEVSEIKSCKHLYKIGFSRVPVEERIKSAAQDPTYLMAPVAIVTAYQCYNFNPQKFELLLHTFFGSVCLNVDVFDENGNRHIPREWFIAPLNVITSAIELLRSGEIVNYRYDTEHQEIIAK